ncbi:hypothetical protein BDV19DRAFT_357936 [Aspergillus venezuelensis]
MAFKVLIIGGSITGLTLAAILERYGIDYTLIEKHADVAPQLGASIGLIAHGARILEQLGCYDEVLPFSNEIESIDLHGADGNLLAIHDKMGTHMEAMHGYRLLFVERQRVLRALWSAIKDKSEVHLSCKLTEIEHLDGGVQVKTQDGRVFSGDMLIGGDGVHSKTREAIWHFLEADGYDTTSDRKAIQSPHSAIFGVSFDMPQLKPGEGIKNVRNDRNYLVTVAPNCVALWFMFFNTRKTAGPGGTVRYTDEEKEAFAAEFANDQIRPGLTFGDMYRASSFTGLVALEEFILERHFYRRILLLGDSVHKMHPITGQGGNAAIEDCAFLANRLKSLLATTESPSDKQLEEVFREVQDVRRPRTKTLTRDAHGINHLEAFDNTRLKNLTVWFFCQIPTENILAGLAAAATPGESLNYLPLPLRSKRLLPYNDEVRIRPQLRSSKESYQWIGLFMLIVSLKYVLPSDPTPELSVFAASLAHNGLTPWRHYVDASYFAVNLFWTVESFRSAFSMGALLSSIPWILLAQSTSWEIALPVYFSLWIMGSSMMGFYYPWPRAILPAVAQALPVALWIADPHFTSSILKKFRLVSVIDRLTAAHVLVPLSVTVISSIITRYYGRRWEPYYQFGNWDMKFVMGNYLTSFLFASIGQASFIWMYIIPVIHQGNGLVLFRTAEVISFLTFTLLIVAWLFFTVWDMNRANITTLTWGRAAALIGLGMVLFGPGATLIGAWGWREQVWEKSRQRISDDRYTKAKADVA